MAPPTVAVNDVLAIDQSLDDSRDSWSSLEVSDVLPPDPPLPPPPPPLPLPPSHSTQGQPDPKKVLKGKVQAGVQKRVNDFWEEKVGRYVMQGDYLALIMEEKGSVSWESFMWDVPQGVLRFAINAGINTLPTFDNLK